MAVAIEHIGSTAVPGLPAKPIIDMDVAIRDTSDLPATIERLAPLGYIHQGEQSILGRDAFAWPTGMCRHHLYVCALDHGEYRRHLLFRDYLRAHADAEATYATVKRQLAKRYRTEREAYAEAKGPFVAQVLVQAEEWACATNWDHIR